MEGSVAQQRGWACPHEPLDERALAAITRARSARLAELFLKCFAPLLHARAPGLAEVVAAFRAEPGEFPDSWPTAVGELRAAMLEQPFDSELALSSALGLGLARAEQGVPAAFRVELGSPRSFLFGRRALPRAQRWVVESDGVHARIEADGHSLALSRVEEQWRGEGVVLPMVRGAVLFPRELPDALTPVLEPDVAVYEAVYQLVADHAALYLPWVERVVRTLVPVESRPGATTSSSFELLPGVVALSAQSPVICLADALVHEASHQHFHLLAQRGPVHDGSDQELYWSPGPRRNRPIDKILLAYHAFANVLCFYRACRDNGFADPELCLRRERSYAESVAQLDAPLGKTRALTPLGRALYEPLRERVSAGEPASRPRAEGHALPA